MVRRNGKWRVQGTPSPHNVSLEDAIALWYQDLRDLAHGIKRREFARVTLEPTEIVHVMVGEMQAQGRHAFNDRRHLFAYSARALRNILRDHIRKRDAGKRGRHWQRVSMSHAVRTAAAASFEDGIDLHRALGKLLAADAEAAAVVWLRFSVGLREQEIARLLGRSERWVRVQWSFARAWLLRELAQSPRRSSASSRAVLAAKRRESFGVSH